MPKMLLELSEEEDRIVDMYKLLHGLRTKQEAAREMIRQFKAEIKLKRAGKEDYFNI